MLRAYVETIPRIVHFVKMDPNRANFQLVHFLAIKSAADVIKPDRIIMHSGGPIEGGSQPSPRRLSRTQSSGPLPAFVADMRPPCSALTPVLVLRSLSLSLSLSLPPQAPCGTE